VTASADVGNEWVVVRLPDPHPIIVSGEFFVAMEWPNDWAEGKADVQWLGLSAADDEDRSWVYRTMDGAWNRGQVLPGYGPMIRVAVEF
jgi:hypothetical protein